jgi:TonB-linked SusC/RagA family outer membrane protein
MRLIFLLSTFILFLNDSLLAQEKTITGRVVDAKSVTPLQGVTVTVKGTTRRTQTDANGNYSIMAASNEALIFSSVSYVTREISVGNNTTINMSLDIDEKLMSEVVVTGVGVATDKKKIALDVASLSSKDIPKSTVGSIESALQGKIAGAQIQFNSGTPGTGATIQLRGVTNLDGAQPMIMVDGVEVSDLNGLDVGSIDRVEVVKGAAAGMLYGAQGANGVIQIFTKKGSKNKATSIFLNTQISFDQIIKGNRPLVAQYHSFATDAQGYLTKAGHRITMDATGLWEDPDFLDPQVDPDLKQDKPYKEKVYNHLDQAYNKATTNNISLTLNGGGDKSDYAITMSRYYQQNVLNNHYERYNLTTNLGFDLFKGFSVRNINEIVGFKEDLLSGDADITITQTNSNRFTLTNSWPFIDFLFKDSTGHYAVNNREGDQALNPLSESQWHQRNTKSYRVLNNVDLNYKFPKFVELDYKFGLEIWNTDYSNLYLNQSSSLQYSIAKWGLAPFGSLQNSYARFTLQNSLATATARFDFQKDFNSKLPIRSTTLVAYDWRKKDYHAYYAIGSNLPSYPPANINSAAIKNSGDGLYGNDPLPNFTFATYGILVSQSFDYANLLGISGGFRSDYSSEFGEADKPFTFPRGTIYFRPSELFKINNLQDWKLRAAYGEAGIQPTTYSRQPTLGVYPLGNSLGLYLPNQLTNPQLQVQRNKELELGTDLTLTTNLNHWFKRFLLSATWWKKESQDIIQNAPIPISAGAGSIIDNLVSITSRGLDLSLDADILNRRKITWNMGIRYGRAKSIADHISGGKDIVSGFFAVKEGQELGILYAPTPLHSLDQVRPDSKIPYIDPADKSNYTIVNGIVVDKRTNAAVITDANDQSVLGSVYPKFNMSFINTFTLYHNLTISAQLEWYYGNKIYNTVRQWLYRDRLSKDYDEPINVDGKVGAFVNFYNSLYNSVQPLSYFVEDGSFARLRDLSVTYNFTDKLKFKWVKNVSLSLSGRNLFTITQYKGLDPEATGAEDSQGNPSPSVAAFKGADYFHVPNLKSFIIGLNIGF